MSEQQPQEPNLSVGRNIKIGLFHLGSGMADVVTTGIWNRIMITDLGFSATPIGLLVSLRYFLAPLGVWAGRLSDRRTIGGYRRLFWIWLGRAMMALSILALGLSTGYLARGGEANVGTWLVMSISLLLFSLGSAISGSTFLALIYDRAAPSQRGRAVGIVWTFLLLGFTIGGILFGVMLPSKDAAHPSGFSPETLQNLFVFGAIAMAVLWGISVFGEERRNTQATSSQEEREPSTSLRADLKLAWSNRQTRFFFWYLALSMMFAFSQDLILEPFAGEVFKMDAAHTTRFAGYWGSMSILASIAFLWLGRRYKGLSNTLTSYIGVAVLIVAFGIFALSAFAEIRPLVTIGLVVLGLGLGIWNIGTLGMMMEMSPFGRAGTFLGFWSLVVTFARGIGVSGGGIIRDLGVSLTGDPKAAYGLAFLLAGIGLTVAYWTLRQVNVKAFQAEQGMKAEATTEQVLAGAMD